MKIKQISSQWKSVIHVEARCEISRWGLLKAYNVQYYERRVLAAIILQLWPVATSGLVQTHTGILVPCCMSSPIASGYFANCMEDTDTVGKRMKCIVSQGFLTWTKYSAYCSVEMLSYGWKPLNKYTNIKICDGVISADKVSRSISLAQEVNSSNMWNCHMRCTLSVLLAQEVEQVL